MQPSLPRMKHGATPDEIHYVNVPA